MTGKDFFGRLLTNREEEFPPPRDDRGRAISPTDTSESDRRPGTDDASRVMEDDAPRPRVRYVETPVAELSTYPLLEDEQEDPTSIETSFDPSALRRDEHGGPGGDGLSSDLLDLRPAAPPEESTDDPSTAHGGSDQHGAPDFESAPLGPDVHSEPDYSRLQPPDVAVTEPPEVAVPQPPITQEPEPPVPEPPIAREMEPPVPEPPIAQEPQAPVAREPEAPIAQEPQVPIARDPEPPLTHDPEPDPPIAQESPAPIAQEPTAPAAQESETHAAPAQPIPEEPASNAADQADREQDESAAPRAKRSRSAASDVELAGIRDRVVLRLLEKQIVTEQQVKKALKTRSTEKLKATLWRIVAQDPTVDREKVYREAALTYAFVERGMEGDAIDLEFVRQVADVFPEKKRNRLIELRIVPVGYEFEPQTQTLRVVFITHDPSLPAVRELMQDLNLERYELQYAPETMVRDMLARAFPKKNEYLERMSDDPLAYDLGASYDDEKSELIDEEALEAEINRSSLINLFEAALVEAVHRGASDIHIYPNARRQIEFHFRVDGRLAHWHTEDKVHPESLLAVIKDNTMNVDRFEREMAQDGFIQRKVDDALIRYRVSILPIATASNNLHAESIVIRVLDDRKVITDLSRLGLLKGALERFDMAIRQPHGMVILTGPTGSGKSTTLVAALHQVVTPEVNVLTVEDPVEYIIPGVRQIKLNHKLGLEGALRAILRHDPDVVMVGEMRDRETAELAVKLANTGHLTFSTLHTNDAPSAVSRLYKMGVEPFLIAYAINLVVAQRLLRNLCPECKVVDNDPDPVLLNRLGFTDEDIAQHPVYSSSGDPTCKTCKGLGYKGRRAISEALYFSREIRHMIVEADQKIDEDALRELARSQGMLTLQDSAREVVKMGETSVEEMMRVTMTEE